MKKKKKKTGRKVVRQLVPRAGVALKNEFYFETSIILSTLFESRLKNLITRVEKVNPGFGFGLDRCIKRVKYLIVRNPGSLIAKYFDLQLVDSLRAWKNHRNGILKDMLTVHVSDNRMKKLAQEGVVLFQELNEANKQFKKEWKKELVKGVPNSPIPDESKE
jgi:hypothetical protein